MTTILLGTASALLIGGADLFGSLAGRRGRVLAVTLWVVLAGTGVILVGSVLVGGQPRLFDLALGAGAGIFNALGLFALYLGYARTTIGIVGPITAVLGAMLPVAVGVVRSRPSPVAAVGMAVGLVAVGLIGLSPDPNPNADGRGAVFYGLLAGFAFGIMATVIGFTAIDAGMWPVLPMRITGALTLVTIALVTNQAWTPERASWKYIPAASLLSASGVGVFTLAAQRDLSIAGLLLQMGYAVTAVLAIIFFRERSSPPQRIGFVGAAVALAMITLG